MTLTGPVAKGACPEPNLGLAEGRLKVLSVSLETPPARSLSSSSATSWASAYLR